MSKAQVGEGITQIYDLLQQRMQLLEAYQPCDEKDIRIHEVLSIIVKVQQIILDEVNENIGNKA